MVYGTALQWLLCAALTIAAALSPNVQRFDTVPSSTSLFVADVTSSLGSPQLVFTQGAIDDPNRRAIMVMTRNGNTWSPATPLPFSGQWRDLEAVLSPDGQTLIFASNRPATGATTAIDGFFGGKVQPARGGNLWRVARNGSRWSTPERLGDAINVNSSVFAPALAADGTLYFMRMSDPGPHFHLYVARLQNGTYRSAERAPFGDPQYSDFDPTVAPDNSFVIFGSNRPPAKPGTSDLFISYNRNGTWTPARDMGSAIDPNGDATEPRLSPDARTLYFSSQNSIWSLDITSWVDGQEDLSKPATFEPHMLAGTLTPSFDPGNHAMLFTGTRDGRATILESRRKGETWLPAAVVSFSGTSSDMDPAISSDGSFVVFASVRNSGPSTGVFLWRADRIANGWSAPRLLPPAVNIAPNIFAPSVAADGTIYFLHSDPKTRTHQLDRSRFFNGAYERAQPLAFSSPATMDADPATSPDQSSVVFVSRGRRGPLDTHSHLYITHACGAQWSSAKPVRYAADYESGADDSSPVIARDGRTLYFSHAGTGASQVLSIPLNLHAPSCATGSGSTRT